MTNPPFKVTKAAPEVRAEMLAQMNAEYEAIEERLAEIRARQRRRAVWTAGIWPEAAVFVAIMAAVAAVIWRTM